jgi:energy-coupling factor transporter ATP-binding protein EcfA2
MSSSIYLITGPSGAGKTSLSNYLAGQGHQAIDADGTPGLCYFVNKAGKPVPYPPTADAAWWDTHNYVWELSRLERIIRSQDADRPVFLCGNAGNIDKAWDAFEAVFYLDVPKDVMIHRLTAEDRENSFGRRVEEQALLLRWVDHFKADMLGRGAISLDATRPLKTIATDIIAHTTSRRQA